VSVCLFGSLLFGFNISILNTSINTIASDFNWCEVNGQIDCNSAVLKSSFINSAVIIGAAVGAMAAARVLKFGCRTVTSYTMIVFFAGVFVSVVAEGYVWLMMGRIIVGFGVGIMSVVSPTYIAEITPAMSRGKYGTLHQICVTLGNFIAVLLGLPLTVLPKPPPPGWLLPSFDKVWWRVMLGIGIVPVAFAVFTFIYCFTFETPFHYVSQGRRQDAHDILVLLRNSTDIETELAEIERTINSGGGCSKLPVVDIFRKWKYFRILAIGVVLSAGQQFVGINAFMTASNKLFIQAGLTGSIVTGMSCVLTGLQVVMTIPAMFLVEHLGRRKLLLFGLSGMIVSVTPATVGLWMFPNSSVTASFAIAGAFGFIIFFGLSYGPLCWIYIFEMFPSKMQAFGSAVAAATNWISAFSMTFMAIYIDTTLNYSFFLSMQIVYFVFTLFFVKETKGRMAGDSPYLCDVTTSS